MFSLFKSDYVVRHHEPQVFVNGHATTGHTDTTQRINVQPLSPNELQALPEGERTVKRIKAYSAHPFVAADQKTGTPGDLLKYQNDWYECKSSVFWGHTILEHYKSDFVIVPKSEAGDYYDD